jgi:hypothetical protein
MWYKVGNNNSNINVDWDNITNKPDIPVSANLSGQAAVFGQSQQSGLAKSFARSDHYHALPNVNWTDIGGKPVIPAAQIQSDWNQATTTALDFIKNKPAIPEQVQSDWDETNSNSKSYIRNKPSNIGGGSGFWTGANTGGDCDIVTTPGAYSGSWINSPPGTTWGTLLVLPSDVGTSYRQQIFIPENGSQMYFRGSVMNSWVQVSTGAEDSATLPPLPWRLDGNIAIVQQYTSPIGTQGLYIISQFVGFEDKSSIYPPAAFEVSTDHTTNASFFSVDNDGIPYFTVSNRQSVAGSDSFFSLGRPSYRNPAYRKGFRMRYDSTNNRLYVEKNSTGGSSNWTAATWNSAGYFS